MTSRFNRDKLLSNLDDHEDTIPITEDKKKKKKKTKHESHKKSKTTIYNNLYRPVMHGEKLNHFIQNKIFFDYLKCEPISTWTYPTRSTDKIELEPIPSTFLPPFNTDPIYMSIIGVNGTVERVQRVCGYREMYMKKLHIQYLKDKEKEQVLKIMYPENSDMMIKNADDDDVMKNQIQQRFRSLALGGGSHKKTKRKKTKHKKSTKNKKRERSITPTKSAHKSKKTKNKKDYDRKKDKSRSRSRNRHKSRKQKTSPDHKRKRSHRSKNRKESKYKNDDKSYKRRPVSLPSRSKMQSKSRRYQETFKNFENKKDREKKADRHHSFSKRKPERLVEPEYHKRNKYSNSHPKTNQRSGDVKVFQPLKNSSNIRDENNNLKEVIRPKVASTTTPKEMGIKNHAEIIEHKLKEWVNRGNHDRVRSKLSQQEPDENANYLPDNANDQEKMVDKYSSKIYPSQQQHTIINMMHDNYQTPSKIAAQFRSQPISVYTVATTTNRGKTVAPPPKKNVMPVVGKKSQSSRPSQAAPQPAFDITNYDSYYEYVFGVKLKDLPERDSEWLELSPTDEELLGQEIQSFDKPSHKPKWMYDAISYESQQLIHELKFMFWACFATARLFYCTAPNFLKGHIEFSIKRYKMIPFFFSTFLLWSALVIMTQSYFSITFSAKKINSTTIGSSKQRVQVEQLEIRKYGESCFYVMANLAFVAVWSLLVILRDGQLICHYFNCWCSALAEMETSSAVGIRKITIYNLIIWGVYSAILIVGFIFDFPGSIRGASALVGMLFFRNIFPDIRLRPPEQLASFQSFGLIFIIYTLFCARLLFCLMMIVALLVKNSAEMWNFKFALAFNQLMMTNRGHMKRISLQLPLVKFFTHHRILTALVKMYGEIFGVPIMVYLVVQVGMMTYVLVKLFNFKAGNTKDYNGKHEAVYEYYDELDQKKTVTIKFYHTPVEEISTMVFILGMVCFDYMFTTEMLAAASQSFCDGFEFVRRTNLILCKTSHQRRLVQSLLWSMSDTDPTLLSAGQYFRICRSTIVAGLGAAVAFFSLIIQLQSETEIFYIDFPRCPPDSVRNEKDEIVESRCKKKS